ncbi:MAG: DUF6491 family protein [Gammaproteobacteria bacterium]|nr:DUF6491 family protein [Gammaproteobacteria bacterium]MDH5303068.1 DUF6491 family protein [Gammaproteobacteria bacterium]MDH5321230.1 DUF6491 family protein [Gammaproteobacteria bacterium]
MIKQSVICFSLCFLVACAASDSSPDPADSVVSNAGSDCISESSIRDYTVLDESNLIVRESRSRAYHVELTRPAYGLRSSWQLGFRSSAGRICGGTSDIIVVDGSLGGSSFDRTIRIRSIRRLSPEDEEDLLIRFGKKEPEIEQPRQPEAIEGAEVEELD